MCTACTSGLDFLCYEEVMTDEFFLQRAEGVFIPSTIPLAMHASVQLHDVLNGGA